MHDVIGTYGYTQSNISKRVRIGYNQPFGGKVYQKDGSFLIYHNIILDFGDGDFKFGDSPIGFTALFSDLPCDADGNILLVSHWFTRNDMNEPSKLMLLCSKEPTHRINLETGEVVDNNLYDNYLTQITINYIIKRQFK